MGLGALFAGGAPKLRPVGGNSRENLPSFGELIYLFICLFVIKR